MILAIFFGLIAIILLIVPSALNISLSWYVLKRIRSRFAIVNKVALIFIFISISLFLTLNIRIASILNDTYYSISSRSDEFIDEPLNIDVGSEITLKGNILKVSFKKNYSDSIGLGFLESSSSFFKFYKPRIVTENAEHWLISQGFKINRDVTKNNRYLITYKLNSDEYHDIVELGVYDNGKLKAKLQKRFRKKFYLEDSDNPYSNFLLYVTQSTIWNYLIPDSLGIAGERYPNTLDAKRQDPLSKFLSKVITPVTKENIVKITYLKVESETMAKESIGAEQARIPNRVVDGWCERQVFFKPRWANQYKKKLTFLEMKGDRQGTWLVIKKSNKELSRTFITTNDIKKYIFTDVYFVKCTDKSISVLLSYWYVDRNMSNRKNFSTREKRFQYRKKQDKASLEERRHKWWLTYTWDGELTNAMKFTVSSEATYYDTGINIVGKFYEQYRPVNFVELSNNDYRFDILGLDRRYVVNLSKNASYGKVPGKEP